MNSDKPVRPIDGLEDTRRAAITMINGMRRELRLYTPCVDPRLYDDADLLEAIRRRIVDQPRLHFYLLLPAAATWRPGCPRLLHMTERLSSSLELRTLAHDHPHDRPEFAEGFMIADEGSVLHHSDPRRLIGSYEEDALAKARPLLGFFAELWERGEVDPELRRLGL